MADKLTEYNEKVKRWEKAIEYFERPYVQKWKGTKFENAIKEREQYYPKLLELLSEINKLHSEVCNV
jgi:mannitol/fructose-specific phosphotransferase system IIA component (Ntr-type)